MDRADYYEARAVIANFAMEQARAELRVAKAAGARDATLIRLGVPLSDHGYTWNDATMTIEPVKPTGA